MSAPLRTVRCADCGTLRTGPIGEVLAVPCPHCVEPAQFEDAEVPGWAAFALIGVPLLAALVAIGVAL